MDQTQGISSKSGPYQLDKMFKEDEKGYKVQRVNKKYIQRRKVDRKKRKQLLLVEVY